jgi:hypothetical protein
LISTSELDKSEIPAAFAVLPRENPVHPLNPTPNTTGYKETG